MFIRCVCEICGKEIARVEDKRNLSISGYTIEDRECEDCLELKKKLKQIMGENK